ncbi:MAG TPA: nuclear transport factor 2 family protein [Caulobacter sp.]|nr:nuclear transport factor 2 family protein [Caulobacter sp.]
MLRVVLFAAALALATPALAATPEEDIGVVLDQLHAAAAKADGPTYFALYTPDAVFIGTDAAERWTLPQFRAYAEPHFSKGKGWTYVPRDRHVTLAPLDCRCLAWFDELLDSQSYGVARGTGVLLKTDTGWKVSQYVLTFPIPNDVADEVTERIKAFEAGKAKP